MKVLVTGASGFIGRHLIDELLPTNEVVGVTYEAKQLREDKRLEWVRWDVGHPAPTAALPKRLDAVVHLAQTRNYRGFPERALEITQINLGGLINALDSARSAGARLFVLASSGGVYAPGPGVRTESDSPGPQSFYQATKLAGEVLASRYGAFFSVICLRIFFAYGLGQARDRFIPDLVSRVVNGKAVQLHGPDGFKANPIHVEDVASAFHRALTLEGTHVINVAGPDVISLRRIVELIAARVGREPVIERLETDGRRDLVASTSEMARCLGAPVLRLEDKIAEVCDEVSGALR
jgi:nucleoside-diphosphate-sugar epimerase